jgi:hypothetical protein
LRRLDLARFFFCSVMSDPLEHVSARLNHCAH